MIGLKLIHVNKRSPSKRSYIVENSTVRINGIISLYWWFLVVNNGGLEHNIYTVISNFNYSWLITYVSIVQVVELCTKTHHIIYITWLAHVLICQLSSLFFNYQFPPYYFVVVKVDKYWISIFNCSSKRISSKAFLRLVVVCCWPIYPYPSGWLHWVLDNHTHDDVIKWKQFPRYWPFGGEFNGHRWIPRTKASDAELWGFLCLNKPLSKQRCGWWLQTLLRPLWRHCNGLWSNHGAYGQAYHVNVQRTLMRLKQVNAPEKSAYIVYKIYGIYRVNPQVRVDWHIHI